MTRSSKQLMDSVNALLASPVLADKHFCIAYSGGIDSTVLLHLVSRLGFGDRVRAAHVNHGLHTSAAEWQAHCAAQCARLGVPFTALKVTVDLQSGAGPEAAARAARYAALQGHLRPAEVLLTAHHQRDQLETVLLALLRGSGPEGLAAMPRVIRRHGIRIARPLLSAHPELICAYAAEHQLAWVEDASNAEEGFDRNYLRQQVVPALERRWPSAALAASRGARWCGEAAEILKELAAADAAGALEGNRLELAALRGLSAARQRNLLRYVGRVLALPPPQAVQLEALLAALLQDAPHLASAGHWPGVVVRRYRDRLWFYRAGADPAAVPAAGELSWAYSDELVLPNECGSLRWVPAVSGGISADYLANPVQVRSRSGGERLRLHSGGPRRPLSKLWQELGVVPWMRAHVPLVYAGEQLLAVGDLLVNADCRAADSGTGVVIDWRNKPELR
ncbi:MAG: tRNA lysidine(34) synthetase TilS [Gammaproteobacteria bacterium]|jgi:tRNA(Ile)-lysidine synthase|nr:tRNA lysidine(34) synthetase TilS [Gammaproteobacteria bacterium]